MGAGAAVYSPAEPNIARMYSYWLAGKDHYEADRAAAGQILQRYPEVAEAARANRAFLSRAVRYAARQASGSSSTSGRGCRPARTFTKRLAP